jgi:hypothetical protein
MNREEAFYSCVRSFSPDALKGVRTEQADRELQLCHSERSEAE